MELNGTRILVAGATGVLGRAIATEVSAQGAKVALAGRNAQRLAALGDELDAPVARLDLTEPGTIAACVRDLAAALGGLDALVVATGVVAFGPEPGLGADVVYVHHQAGAGRQRCRAGRRAGRPSAAGDHAPRQLALARRSPAGDGRPGGRGLRWSVRS